MAAGSCDRKTGALRPGSVQARQCSRPIHDANSLSYLRVISVPDILPFRITSRTAASSSAVIIGHLNSAESDLVTAGLPPRIARRGSAALQPCGRAPPLRWAPRASKRPAGGILDAANQRRTNLCSLTPACQHCGRRCSAALQATTHSKRRAAARRRVVRRRAAPSSCPVRYLSAVWPVASVHGCWSDPCMHPSIMRRAAMHARPVSHHACRRLPCSITGSYLHVVATRSEL